MPRKFLLHYLWIVVLVSVLVIAADQELLPEPGTWNHMELLTVDARFALKHPPAVHAARDVALVVIDEETYRRLNQPLIFYHTYIAQVMDYLVRCGVKVIGLDVELPSISLEERVQGGYDSVYVRALLAAKRQGAEVVIVFSSGAHPPLPIYLAAAGRENLAAHTLTLDRDDFVRRQKLRFGAGQESFDAFPYALARKLRPEGPSPPGEIIFLDYSLTGAIPIHPFYQVLQDSTHAPTPDNPFRGKAVIIGTLFTFEDRHATPLYRFPTEGRRQRTPGVLIQATTAATLLSGRFFQETGRGLQGLLIFLAAVITVAVSYNRRPLPAAGLALLWAGVVSGLAALAFSHYYLLRLTPLWAAIFLSYGFTTVFHYYTVERKRRQIQARFASFVPEPVIDRLVEMDVEALMAGEQREVALLFADIRNFTARAERYSQEPRKIIRFLNRYHTEMTEAIHQHAGTVSQLTGDGIFAFFGAPLTRENPVWDAVQAALAMRERVAALQPVWQELGFGNLAIGIGLHVGVTVVGTVGSLKKLDYTAIGDPTNVASRIEGLTKEFHEVILMSQAACERVQDRVAARPLGEATIKGHGAIFVYALDGLKT